MKGLSLPRWAPSWFPQLLAGAALLGAAVAMVSVEPDARARLHGWLMIGIGAALAFMAGHAVAQIVAARERVRTSSDLLETAPDATVVVDPEGRILGVNRPTEVLFGYDRAELLGRPVELLMPERYRARHALHRARFGAQGERRPMGGGRALHGRRRDGREFPVEISLVPIDSRRGRLVSAAIRDVSDRRAAEERFRALLESAPDAMVIVDGRAVIELVNAQAERLFGYERSFLIGEHIGLLVPELREPERIAATPQAPGPTAMGADRVMLARRRDGSEFPVELSASPIETEQGRLVSCAIRDATKRREIEAAQRTLAESLERRVNERTRELEERARELVRSNAELEEFAYVVSHDLKSPLRGISSLAEWLAEDSRDRLDQASRQNLDLLQARVRRMHQLIEGVLSFSRAVRGGATKELDSERIARAALELVDPDGKADFQIEGTLPVIQYDELQLTRVFQNLIGNALQHTSGPRAIVRVSAIRTPEGWEFRVRDNGPGVPPEHRERVFRMFQTLSARSESTGIGLAIVKKIVESAGGRVGVRDAPECGAEFFFTTRAP